MAVPRGMDKKSKIRIHRRLRVQFVLSQLAAVRREFRETLRAYEARLEIALAEVVNEVGALKTTRRLQGERLDQIDNLMAVLQKRRLKPEKGRRKDLRKIEKLITDLRATLPDAS